MLCKKMKWVISCVICVISAHEVEAESERCDIDSFCSWLQWGSWDLCSVTCGGLGTRNRTRPLCCPTNDDFETCVNNCRLSQNESFTEESCGNICYNNGELKETGFGCDCKERSFGHCCEESKSKRVEYTINNNILSLLTK